VHHFNGVGDIKRLRFQTGIQQRQILKNVTNCNGLLPVPYYTIHIYNNFNHKNNPTLTVIITFVHVKKKFAFQ
jgi:hypothetical protein